MKSKIIATGRFNYPELKFNDNVIAAPIDGFMPNSDGIGIFTAEDGIQIGWLNPNHNREFRQRWSNKTQSAIWYTKQGNNKVLVVDIEFFDK